MSDQTSRPPTLLDDLDQRQNQVIRQLDELNDRIEATLSEWITCRDAALES